MTRTQKCYILYTMTLLDGKPARTKTGKLIAHVGAGVGILDEEENKKESEHLSFRCPPELYERLDNAVTRSGWKRSKLIVRLLSYALDLLEAELSAPKKNKK